MFVTHLECSRCHASYEAERLHQICTACGAPLLVRYDLPAIRRSFDKSRLLQRPSGLWRYQELLPLREPENAVSLGEVTTPLLHLPRLGAELGFSRLHLKDEGLNPGGTFKSRGAAVGVSKARELGVRKFAMPTNGNAGAAWSLYAARAGIEALVVMPADAPVIPRGECDIAGARLYLVDGLISDAGKIVAGAVKNQGYMDASTLKEPYRIEGKKTMGLEIAEQLGWTVPDVILYPTGGGVGLIGIHKALLELRELGWIGEKLPRLVAVQAEGCAPIVKAWREGKATSEFWQNASTVAFGITVPKALGDFMVLEAIAETGGCAVAVSDADILFCQAQLARFEGLFVCPEGAATLAAAKTLLAQGWIHPEENVVLLNTGTGLKYPETVQSNPPLLLPGADIPPIGD
jgi:threonine synthase